MGPPSVIVCALVLAICLPAICQGQQYWGGYGWRTVQQPAVNGVCERAYPVDEATAVRTTCRYPCKGWPVRYGFEEDGTPCQLSWWRQGFCFRGRCQRQNLVPSIPREENNNVEERPNPVPVLVCRNRRQRVKFPAVVRSCQFVCKQRRNAFLANEGNGTPCLAWAGKVGYCDQGVCKAVEATVSPTTAQATSTVGSTTPQLPVASSATTAAEEVTNAATEKDVAVSQTDEATTAAATQAAVPVVPAVRPPGRPGFVGVKCDRAYPARVSNGRVAKCRFLCGGTPFLGIGFEADGTPCWIKKTLEGVCFDGKCKPVPSTTEAATTQEASSATAVSTAQTDAAATTGAGDESSTKSTTDAEDAETLSTSTTSGVQEGDETNTNQGATVQAGGTTVTSESVTSEQQAGPEEQATTTNLSPSEGEEAHTEENVSEAARTATTVESATTENTGQLAVEVTTALQQTTVESVREGTAVQTETTDIAGSGQEGTPSVDEATTQNELKGDGEQVTTSAGPATGDDEEEGSGNTEGETASDVSPQEATTSGSGVEDPVAAVSETDAVIVDSSTQSATEGTADGDAKLGTDEPQTSQASVTTTGSDASTDAGTQDQGASSFTEAAQDAQTTASAVTDDFQEVTQTENADKEVVVDVTTPPQENPRTLPAEGAGDHSSATPAADLAPATATSSDVVPNVEKEVTEDQSSATTERAFETTTASVESETAKIITTVTRKEIVRPVGSDDLSEATLVDSTRTTSVETLPVSELNDTGKPNREESGLSVSSDNPSVAADETVVGSQDRPSDGSLMNKPESGAMTASTIEVAEAELVATEQPEAKAVTVFDETAEGTTVADEAATIKIVTTITKKEITRPLDDETQQSEGNSVDTTRTTSVETLPLSEVDEKIISSEGESAVGDTATVAEEVLQPEQESTEVSSPAVAEEAPESTTAAASAESATVKVITTITQKEIVRPVDSDDSQPDAATVVEASKTTSVETLPLSEVDQVSASSTEESAVADTTTVSEEVFQTVQDAAEVRYTAVNDESPESTTTAAAVEPATVKVITTVTHKEIVRPVDSDSQSDATVVDSSKTTSVETLSASEYQKADESNTAQSDVASSNENSLANDDTTANKAVSSGPSIVITDFVQKTASSSKEPVTAPSAEEATDSP